ncbi:hypothetical protein ACFSRY_03750 [Pontibacter locisalis]|uniref:Uncharacterized protein n=1 Tax=Pontibacter locisalis TaxID=1719035 RepID=A0ABW5IJ03_9BACT
MILTLLRYPKLNKLNTPYKMAVSSLLNGEQYLIQTVDKKLALTTHRLIVRKSSWTTLGSQSIMLEDIVGWEVKKTSKSLYFGLSLAMAFMVYFNDSFALLSGFFLMLYIMTRQRRVHVRSTDTQVILPLEVEEKRISNLIDMVRQAQQNRKVKLDFDSALAN